MLVQKVNPPLIGPQGFEQAVPVEETPVMHRHQGLGNRDQFVIKPYKVFFHAPTVSRLKGWGKKGKKALKGTPGDPLLLEFFMQKAKRLKKQMA